MNHQMTEILALEVAYGEAQAVAAAADAAAKAARKAADAAGDKVHAALRRLGTPQPMPLFEAAGV